MPNWCRLVLSIGVGLGVLNELMAEEVDDVVGPKGSHDVERAAVRHGSEAGAVTLGARRVPVQRPRARAADGYWRALRCSSCCSAPRRHGIRSRRASASP